MVVVINATSMAGLFPDIEARLDIDVESLRPGMVVADVIPNPRGLRLVRVAESRGCAMIDGLEMLVNRSHRHKVLNPASMLNPNEMREALLDILVAEAGVQGRHEIRDWEWVQGAYTDAVIFDFKNEAVAAAAKSVTVKEDHGGHKRRHRRSFRRGSSAW